MLVLAQKIRADLDQADQLVESFLLLARAQRGVITDLTTVSPPKLARDSLDDRTHAVVERHLTVHWNLGDAAVIGNVMLLARMVDNVIDNAVRHSEVGSLIEVTTKADGTSSCLMVESGGPHLDQERVDQLAQPFKRLGADRTGSENGLGVGLAIVSAVATAHSGSLHLRARSEGGLQVAISLPTDAPARIGIVR